jgi:hypothetical protein
VAAVDRGEVRRVTPRFAGGAGSCGGSGSLGGSAAGYTEVRLARGSRGGSGSLGRRAAGYTEARRWLGFPRRFSLPSPPRLTQSSQWSQPPLIPGEKSIPCVASGALAMRRRHGWAQQAAHRSARIPPGGTKSRPGRRADPSGRPPRCNPPHFPTSELEPPREPRARGPPRCNPAALSPSEPEPPRGPEPTAEPERPRPGSVGAPPSPALD